MYSCQIEFLPTAHRIFLSPQLWGSVSMQYWPLTPLGLGYFQLQINRHLSQFYQFSPPLGIGENIIAKFSVHFIQFTRVIFYHGKHTCVVWDLPLCGWRSSCMLGVDLWSIFHLATKGVSDWGCLLSSPYGSTVPLRMHAVGYTLRLLL